MINYKSAAQRECMLGFLLKSGEEQESLSVMRKKMVRERKKKTQSRKKDISRRGSFAARMRKGKVGGREGSVCNEVLIWVKKLDCFYFHIVFLVIFNTLTYLGLLSPNSNPGADVIVIFIVPPYCISGCHKASRGL